jgi:hypothetical protein
MSTAEGKRLSSNSSSYYGISQGSYGSHVGLLMIGEILNLVHNTY